MRRKRVAAVVVLVVAVIGAAAWQASGAGRALANAVRFTARMACSCVHISARPLAACVADLPPQARYISLETDPAAPGVRASLLWSRAEARYREGRGCALLEP